MSNGSLNPAIEVQPFASMLQTVPKGVMTKVSSTPRLGRTAALLEGLKEEARQEGYQLGYEQGLEQGQVEGIRAAYQEAAELTLAEVEKMAWALEERAAGLTEAMQRWYQESEEHLAELSALIATRILGRELQTDRDVVLSMVRQAIAEVTHSTEARVRINPLDGELLAAHRDALLATAPSLRKVEFVLDENIEGGCVVETDGGIVDASIGTMISEALANLRGGE